MRVRWHGDQATSRLRSKLYGNVDNAGAQLQADIETRISTPGPPVSRPGTPPHIDEGNLILSWAHETDGIDDIIATRVSTDKDYAVDLEFGTANMAARPFMRRTVIEKQDRYARQICKQ